MLIKGSDDNKDSAVLEKSGSPVYRKRVTRPKKMKEKSSRPDINQFFHDEASEADSEGENQDEDPNAEFYRKQYRRKDNQYEEMINQRPEDIVKRIKMKTRQEKERMQSASHHVPSLKDPKLFAVRCKAGTEREIAFELGSKFNHLKGTKNEIHIISASALDKEPGTVFIEAINKFHAEEACQGVRDLNSKYIKVKITS